MASNEILLQSRQALREGLPDTVAVFESTDYAFPLNHWPTGQYSHQENIVYAPLDAIE